MSIPPEEELLDPKEEPHVELQDVVEQAQVEEGTRGRVEASKKP